MGWSMLGQCLGMYSVLRPPSSSEKLQLPGLPLLSCYFPGITELLVTLPHQGLIANRTLSTSKRRIPLIWIKPLGTFIILRCSKAGMSQGLLFSGLVASFTTRFLSSFHPAVFSVFPFTLQTASSCGCKMAVGFPGVLPGRLSLVKGRRVISFCILFFFFSQGRKTFSEVHQQCFP